MYKPLAKEIEAEASTSDPMNIPSAPPAYDEEFKPPLYNPPPYNPQNAVEQMQQAAAVPPVIANNVVPPNAPYPQQAYTASALTYQQPMMQAPPQIITQTERVIIGHLPVGPEPLRTTCPHCQAQIKTATRVKTHCSAHVTCFILFMFVCWCCSCLPYCMDSFHTVYHSCPNCKAFLGAYQKH